MLPLVIPVTSGSQLQHQVVFETQATYYEGRDQVSTDVKWSWVIFLIWTAILFSVTIQYHFTTPNS